MSDFTVGQFIDEYQGPTVSVQVCPRVDLRDRHAELEVLLAEATRSASGGLADDTVQRLAREIAALEDEIDQSSRTFVFRALSRRRWRALLADHPPRDEDRKGGADFNADTLPAAAIAACAVEPRISADEAVLLEDAINLAEFEKLWGAVLAANLGANDIPKSLIATAVLRTSAASSTTAALEDFLAASS